jgi:phage gpG-like protein
VRSFREPLKRSIQQVMGPSFRQNFTVGGRPAWPPLAEETLRIKSKANQPADILVRTGRLRRVAGQLNLWTLSRDDARVVSIPSGADYGRFHMTGTRWMPAREWMGFQPVDIQAIEQVFVEWIRERAERHGWKS